MILTKDGFNIIRNELFGGKLDQAQVDAIIFIVTYCTQYDLTYPEAAYLLATVYHETGLPSGYRTMQPIKEAGSDSYLRSKKYYPYIGYGYVQLTWKENYERIGKLIGIDLVKNPEKALEPLIAIQIAIKGMLNGWFTGVGFRRKRPVSKYNKQQYVSARNIINGKDKAELIAKYAIIFERALRSL
ncbi:endolysin [Acinetobacter phage Paty]|uniref:Endolysin n=1 Tax=Acinetobacter phage Paty TaxID=2797426 RepID=A0A7T7GTB4_9CAUD|nr:endolysin [Acinetobacter phage Paty]